MEKQEKQQDAEREQLAKSKSLVKNKLVVAAIVLVCAVALVMGGYFTYSAYIANGFLKSVAATMHSYLQSAYYSIEPENDKGESIDTLELDAAVFQGLGNKGYPFRGVIVGNLRGSSQVATQAAIKIRNSKDTGALSGLIPYSYGSVVSNLNIEYSGKAASIAHKNKDASGVPGAFFGGVIGCVRSGTDGLYENVTDGISNYVTGASELAEVKAEGNAITFTDTKENGKFKTQNAGTTFSLPFTVTVKMQVEPSRFYANYRLVMTASLVKGDMASATPQSPDYVTYTLTRVNLNGIDH